MKELRRFASDKYRIVLLLAIIICSIAEGLRQITGIPIVHLGNIIIFVMFFPLLLRRGAYILNEPSIRLILLGGVLFLLFGSLSAILFESDFRLYLWSLRNYLRFFVLFLDCYLAFDKDDAGAFYRLLDLVIVIHIVLTLIQFFGFGIRWDYLNGIFGTGMGGNSAVNILLLIITCICLYRFSRDEIKWPVLLLHISWMCYNAALNELKVYIVELVLALVIFVLVTGEYKRMLKLSPAILVIVYSSMILMYMLYPYYSAFYALLFVDFKGFVAEPHHENPDSLGRMYQISGVTKPIMEYAESVRAGLGKMAVFTGLGLGSGELSTIGMFDSRFYLENIRLWYWDFLLSMIYIETGILGLVIYCGTWLIVPVRACIDRFRNRNRGSLMMILSGTMMIFVMVYDSALRNNYGYMMWAFLGIVYSAFARGKDEKSKTDIY